MNAKLKNMYLSFFVPSIILLDTILSLLLCQYLIVNKTNFESNSTISDYNIQLSNQFNSTYEDQNELFYLEKQNFCIEEITGSTFVVQELPVQYVFYTSADSISLNATVNFAENSTSITHFRANQLLMSSFLLSGIVSICVAIGFLLIIIFYNTKIAKLKTEKEIISLSEEQFRIAASQRGTNVIRYDIKLRKILQASDSESLHNIICEEQNFPYCFIDKGIIASQTANELAKFLESLHCGEQSGACVIKINDKQKNGSWYSIKFTTIYSKDDEPQYSIISYSNITVLREKELSYAKWRQYVDCLPKDKITLFEHNLTQDICESVEGDLISQFANKDSTSFDNHLSYIIDNYVYSEDRKKYQNTPNRDELLNNYLNGVYNYDIEFRIVTTSCSLRWIQLNIQLVQYPDFPDIKAFILYQDIDDSKKTQLLIKSRSQEDSLTGVLNRTALVEKVTAILSQTEPGMLHAIIMIDLDNFKQVNDNLGHLSGDKILINVAEILKKILRVGDLIGRIGGDEFLICLKNIPCEDVIHERAIKICSAITIEINDYISIHGSLGIAMYPQDGTTFDALYRKADIALYEAKRQGRNCHKFYTDTMESSELFFDEEN